MVVGTDPLISQVISPIIFNLIPFLSNSLIFSFRKDSNRFNKNLLILGEGLHTIHPIAGQGFNLVLRDIEELHKKIHDKTKLLSLLHISNTLGTCNPINKIKLTNIIDSYNVVTGGLCIIIILDIKP